MEHIDPVHQFFISIRYDRKQHCPVIMYSKHGGLTLEKIRRHHHDSLKKIHFDPLIGLDIVGLMQVAKDLGIQHK